MPPRFGLSENNPRVHDLPRAVAFHRDVVGLVAEREPSPAWAWHPDDNRVELAGFEDLDGQAPRSER